MAKLKTSKSASKRFKVTGSGKLTRRPVNAGHFNAKDSGNERRAKNGDLVLKKANHRDIDHLMPYHGHNLN